MPEKYYTLVFIHDNQKVLLGRKKRGFGKGLFNGFGGKIEQNEDKFESAVREVKEECNLDINVEDLHSLGCVTYTEPQEKRIVYIFTIRRFKGQILESDEMAPSWFDINKMPLKQMHKDFSLWHQLVIHEVQFNIDFVHFDGNGNNNKREQKPPRQEMIMSLSRKATL